MHRPRAFAKPSRKDLPLIERLSTPEVPQEDTKGKQAATASLRGAEWNSFVGMDAQLTDAFGRGAVRPVRTVARHRA